MAEALRKLGRTGLRVSPVGFGCYRIENEEEVHRAALKRALLSGCRLIDTSTNYTDGSSETCVGEVVAALAEAGRLPREQLVVVSKVGYVQGHNLELAAERESAGKPYPDLVKYMEGCWHCLHPQFIQDQLDLSLGRLKMDRIDVYLLHNPEYFFSDAQKRATQTPLADLREQFYERIRGAFEYLESEVAAGRIGAYGVSSNTFGGVVDGFETTSLTRMWELARAIGGESHHFSVIQLPMNLFEGGPALHSNNGPDNSLTVLEYAAQNDLGVLVNRPLNGIVGNQMVRLADFPVGTYEETVASQAEKVREHEEVFARDLAPHIKTADQSVKPSEFFRWGTELSNPQVTTLPLEQWTMVENQIVLPQTNHLVSQLNQHYADIEDSPWPEWRNGYLPELGYLLKLIRNESAKRSQAVSDTVSKRLEAFLPPSLNGQTLSRKALAVVANTPGVTCVLNGMRQPAYVDDSLGVLGIEPFEVKKDLYRAFCKTT